VKVAELVDLARGYGAVEGIERDLRERRWRGTLAGVGAVIVQVVVLAANKDYLARAGQFFSNLFSGQWDRLIGGKEGLNPYELLALGVLIAGAVIFIVLRNTQVLLRDSKEPFHYTFSIAPFVRAGASPGGAGGPPSSADGVLGRLHLDLINRLSDRHHRLSLLDPGVLPAGSQRRLSSHIHVGGQCVVKQREPDAGGSEQPREVIEVMPRVRIGPPDQPEQVVDRTEHAASEYEEVVREVQSHIERAIYAQILGDIRKKILLYPTSFRRGVGLFYEAEDFEHSNTIDAYDHAITLYRQALLYFQSSWTRKTRWLWPPAARRAQLLEARARVAFSRCLIFRRLMSTTAGRRQNPIYEARKELSWSVGVLDTLYRRATRHVPRRDATVPASAFELIMGSLTKSKRRRSPRRQASFEECRAALFEAHVIFSLFYSELPAREPSQASLDRALATSPDTAEQNALYLLAKAQLPADLIERQRLLQKATEHAPRSETIHYRHALILRSRFLRRNDLAAARGKDVASAFARAQKLNPGNIASYAASGYIWWLVEDCDRAELEYQRGMNVKAIQQDTFVGDLSYGLARIAAERGHFDQAYDLYQQSIDANPNVAACTSSDSIQIHDFYSFMTPSTLARFERFLQRVQKATERHAADREAAPPRDAASSNDPPAAPTPSSRTCNGVLGFVLNDCANAYFNRYTRSGVVRFLDKAIELFERAKELAPNIAVVPFNLSYAYSWKYDFVRQLEALRRAAQLAPSCGPWLMALLERHLDDSESQRSTLNESVTQHEERAKALNATIGQLGKALTSSFSSRKPKEPAPREQQQEPEQAQGASEQASQPQQSEPQEGPKDPIQQTRAFEQASQQQQSEQAKAAFEQTSRQRELEQARQELRELEQTLEAQRQRLDELETVQNSVPALFARVLANSRFAALFPRLDSDGLGWVEVISALERFAADGLRRVDVASVDEDFVDLLLLLARVSRVAAYVRTSKGGPSPPGVGTRLSRDFYAYILDNFNNDDAVAHSRLLDQFGDTTKDEDIDVRNGRCGSIAVVQRAIEWSLADDPRQWSLLGDWAPAYWQREVGRVEMHGEDALREFLTSFHESDPQVLALGPLLRLKKKGITLSPEATLRRERDGHAEREAWLVCDPPTGRSFRFEFAENATELSVRFSKPDPIDAFKRALDSSVDFLDRADAAVLQALWARACQVLGRRDAAIGLFNQAVESDPSNPEYLFELGDLHLEAEETDQACRAYRRAIAHAPQQALEGLAKAEQQARKPGRLLEQVSAALQALRELALPVEKHREYAERIAELEQEQTRLRRFGEPIGDDATFIRPMVVELGFDLVNVVNPKQDDGDFIERRVLALREALERDLGVSVPGLLFRLSYTLVGSEYSFMIDEIPVASGVVESATEPSAPGAAGQSKADGLLDKLEALIRPNVARFFGIEECERLCERWREDERSAALLRDLVRDENDRVALARVVRTLLSEQIPVVDHRTILETLREVGLRAETLADAIELLRQRLKSRLPGNSGEVKRIERPAALAESLAELLSSPESRGAPRVAPQAHWRMILEVEALLKAHATPSDGRNTAIVVDDGAQRVLARRALESRFPGLMWLSRGELPPDGGTVASA
jgi:tetratricopeptide (TPR) repeat protein